MKKEAELMREKQRKLTAIQRKAKAQENAAKLKALKEKENAKKAALVESVLAKKAAIAKAKLTGKGKARYVVIKLDKTNYLYLVEVQIFENEVNVAKNKKTKQSSTPDKNFSSDKAIDGDENSYSATNNRNASWQIHLDGYFKIDKMKITTRSDEKWEELKNATVYALDADKKILFKKKLQGITSQEFSVSLKPKEAISVEGTGPAITNFSTIAVLGNLSKKYCMDNYIRKRFMCDGNEIETKHKFHIIRQDGGKDIKSGDKILLRSMRNKYCKSEGNQKRVVCNTSRPSSETVFTIINKNGGTIYGNDFIILKAYDNSYCSEQSNGQIGCFSKTDTQNKLFRIILLEKGTKTGEKIQSGTTGSAVSQINTEMKKTIMTKYKLTEAQFSELVKMIGPMRARSAAAVAGVPITGKPTEGTTIKSKPKVAVTSKQRETEKLYLMGIDNKFRIWRKSELNIQKSKWRKIAKGNNAGNISKIHFDRNNKLFYGITSSGKLLKKTSESIGSNWIQLGLTNVKYVSSNDKYIYTIDTNNKIYRKEISKIKTENVSLTDTNNGWEQLKNSNNIKIKAIAFDNNIMHGIDDGSLYKKQSIDPNSAWVKIEGINLLDIEFRTGYLFGIGSDKKVYRKLKRSITSKMVNYESCCLLSFTFGLYSTAQASGRPATQSAKTDANKKPTAIKSNRATTKQPAARQTSSRQPAVRQTSSRQPAVRQTSSRQPAVRQTSSRQPAVRQTSTRTRTRTGTREAETQQPATRTRTRTRR